MANQIDDTQEQVILVDANDHAIGTAGKLEAHRRGELHRAFSVIIWDRCGRLLLQKRHDRKYHSAGLWTNACCGHPRPGEDIAAAAKRRLQEEMGFTCQLTLLGTISYKAPLDRDMIEHELVHVFRGVYDGAIAPHPAEVDGFRWCRFEDVLSEINAAPEQFTVWFRKYVSAGWPMEPLVPHGDRSAPQ